MRLSVTLLLLCFHQLLFAQTERLPLQDSPRNVVEEIFRCARTGDFSQVHLLCDPNNEHDGDTKRICSLQDANDEMKREFMEVFKLAFTSAEVQYINEIAASVPFKFGPKVEKVEEMNVVKRGDKWYLISF